MSRGPNLTTQGVVDWFNETHPVGTPVTAFPGTLEGRAVQGETRTRAWALGDSPVVAVTGLAGGIHLSHIVCKNHASHAVEVAS